jgi:class 3 adenylate cyclase
MQCPRCQHETPRDAEFCQECRAELVLTCTACGSGNATSHKFCKNCGARLTAAPGISVPGRILSSESYVPTYLAQKILSLKATLQDERKQVTVLFADIKSSLELLADRDPEEAGKLFDAVLERMIEAVHRYEGTVNHVMGDGLMALFGAPVAHEDHALRACYAALMMQEAIQKYSEEIRRKQGLTVQIRVGLNAGEVIIHAVRRDLQMDYTVVGLTVHLAARMEQIATPGCILITPSVLRLVEGYVNVKSLGPIPIKGLQQPMDVYEVVGAGSARSRLQAAAARGLTRFVGRFAEVQALCLALARARTGHGQVVAVVGGPGIGKSRLIHEFIHSPHTQSCLVLETNTVSYDRATPYLPVINFLKNYFDINPRNNVRTIRERVTGKVLALDQSLQEMLAPILDLLDALPNDHSFLRLDPVQRRQQTIQSLKSLILRESQVQPLVVVFEDLHWQDSLSLGILEEVVDSLQKERVLLIVSYRSEYQDNWTNRSHYQQLQLYPLPDESMEELLNILLGADVTLYGVKTLLMERAEGNPFFLEELVRTLVETGALSGERAEYRLSTSVSTIQVPPKVQAVIAARIDRLPQEQKRVIQEAAVVGKDVSFSLLNAITDQSEEELRRILSGLQSSEFLYESQLFPELEYTFKHALTHKVAYEGLLQERRREIHARIVTAIEKLHSGRLNEYVERLARHAFAGEVWRKALTYLRRAGAKFIDRPANREAVALFQQALQALTHLPADRNTLEQGIDIRFEIRNALQPLGELAEIIGYLKEAEDLARQLDDRRRLGWVASYLCEHFRMLGNPESAADAGEHALAIAQSLPDFPMQAVTNLPMGLLYHALGEYPIAVEFFKFNIDRLSGEQLNERFGLFGLASVFSRTFQGYCFAELGKFAEGISIAEEGVRIATATDHPYSRVYAHLGMGYLYLHKGELRQAIATLQHALEIGQFTQIPVGFAYGASYLGYALALVGHHQDALSLLEQTVEPGISTKFIARHSLRVAFLGHAYLLAGRVDEARKTVDCALELARAHKERGNEAYTLRLLGEVAAAHEEFASAESYYRSAILLAEELGTRPVTAHSHWGLARLTSRLHNQTAAEEHIRTARVLFREMDMIGWLYQMESEFESQQKLLVDSL